MESASSGAGRICRDEEEARQGYVEGGGVTLQEIEAPDNHWSRPKLGITFVASNPIPESRWRRPPLVTSQERT
jgi:hypothetical protein